MLLGYSAACGPWISPNLSYATVMINVFLDHKLGQTINFLIMSFYNNTQRVNWKGARVEKKTRLRNNNLWAYLTILKLNAMALSTRLEAWRISRLEAWRDMYLNRKYTSSIF